jgi:transcriptional regulator with XRE-family HTH domain
MTTKSLIKKLNELVGEEESLGDNLKTIRLCDEMTLKEFAAILGVSVHYLSDVEHGRRFVSPKKAYEYAEKLGYSTAEFVRLALQDEANSFLRDKGMQASINVNFAAV